MDENYIKDAAVISYKAKMIAGFFFGILTIIAAIILFILTIVYSNWDLFYIPFIMFLVGSLLSTLCGYFVFKKKHKKETDLDE